MVREELLALLGRAKAEGWTRLNLAGMGIEELPPEIGGLTELEVLILGKWDSQFRELKGNRLTTLPPEIAQLTNLTTMSLWNNQLSQLPEAIAQLANLTSLNLSNNQLSQLPEAIPQLTNLTSLNLNGNRLSQLPESIAQLTNLTKLYLNGNQLSQLPESIAQLTNLTSLDLNGNRLSQLPESIAQLTNLTWLYLGNNKLTEIPAFVRDLPKLKNLDLRGNPLPIPPEILGAKESWEDPGDLTTILNFYFNTQQNSAPLYEAKLLIVGEGGAGKTSLAKKLQNPNYQLEEQEKSTEGIEVIRWEIQHPNGTPLRVHIWDFGGQEIYHATHQFFLTKRSLYVLVADTRQENTDFYYWLNIIRLLSDSSPVVIIKNEKQDRQCNIDDRTLRGEFTNLEKTLATNLQTNRGLETLQTAIQTHLSQLEHVGTNIPAHWAKIRAVLENYSQNRNHLDLRDYFDLCRQNGFRDETEMLAASNFLHNLGICLHFQNVKGLRKTLILNPEWATSSVYKILDNKKVRNNFGRFNDQTLEKIWDEGDAATMRDELLQLMMEFELCYEIPGRKGSYISPQLLQKERLDYDWNNTDNLILSYRYEFKPKDIFPRLIVAMHEQIENQCRVWKHGVVLTNGYSRAEIIEEDRYHKAEIKIRVSGSNKRALLSNIAYELEKIQNTYDRIQYETLIPCNCPTCKGSQTPHTYPWQNLQRRLANQRYTIECEQSYTQVNVRSLIDDIAEPQRPEFDREFGDRETQREPTGRSSPFGNIYIYQEPRQDNSMNQAMTNITQTHHGSGDNVAGDKNTTHNHAPQTPNQSAQQIQDLLAQLNLTAKTTQIALATQIASQPSPWQHTLWAALKNAGPELAKNGVAIALGSAGLPGAIAAGAFSVVIEAVRGGLEARGELPPNDPNPFGDFPS